MYACCFLLLLLPDCLMNVLCVCFFLLNEMDFLFIGRTCKGSNESQWFFVLHNETRSTNASDYKWWHVLNCIVLLITMCWNVYSFVNDKQKNRHSFTRLTASESATEFEQVFLCSLATQRKSTTLDDFLFRLISLIKHTHIMNWMEFNRAECLINKLINLIFI